MAIAAIELVLTGEISTDDYMIEVILENMKVVNEKNKAKYDKKVESQKQKKLEDQQLSLIADLYLQGVKQKDIAKKIGTTPQTISNRLALIRTDYSYLLEKNQVNQANQENQVNQVYDNDNVNDNDNDNMEKFVRNAQILPRESCGKPQASNNRFTF